MNSPAERAVFRFLRDHYSIHDAFRFLIWRAMHLSGRTIQDMAQTIGKRPIWVHNRISAGKALDLLDFGLLTYSLDLDIEIRAVPR